MALKHYFQRSFLNSVRNKLLQANAWHFSKRRNNTECKIFPPDDYELVFEDEFKSEKLSDKWIYGQPWGFFHPNQLYWYWTENAVKPSQDGIILENLYLPKTIYKKDLPEWQQNSDLPEEFVLPWASGLISSKKSFKFGWIEAFIQLPVEKMQWSAFWTSGLNTWPPEIDILEAYTDQDVTKIKIKPNIHWKTTKNKKSYGAPTIPVKNPSGRFVQYAIHWTEDFIKFYYDGILVQVCENREMLQDNSAEQFIILNNGLQEPTATNSPTEGKMFIKNLKVFQQKNSSV